MERNINSNSSIFNTLFQLYISVWILDIQTFKVSISLRKKNQIVYILLQNCALETQF